VGLWGCCPALDSADGAHWGLLAEMPAGPPIHHLSFNPPSVLVPLVMEA
jgi:hypothetical protein